MKYFKDCRTLEEVKKAYKEWAKKLHPDCGGDGEAFKAMKAEYERAFEACKNTHKGKDGSFYQKETNETAWMYADIIEQIIRFEGCLIEIVGSWIWVSGDTKPYKDQLKELHFFWSSNKKAWYFTGSKEKSAKKGKYSMNAIRNMWGSEIVTADTDTVKKLGVA